MMFRGKIFVLSCLALLGFTTPHAHAVVLFEEDFESVVLGPIVTFGDSDSGGETPNREAWSNAAPNGFTIDASGVPGDSVLDGVQEFRGWTFVDREWWIETAGDQARSNWTGGYGTVAQADPDEFDDFSFGSGEGAGPAPDGCDTSAGATNNCYDTQLLTPQINIAGQAENSVRLVYDSSWRPEDSQKARLEVSFDGGDFSTLFTYESVDANGDPGGTFTKITDANGVQIGDLASDLALVDDVVDISLNNPSGASTAQIRWDMFDAGNDWWWAIDNLQVYSGTPGPRDPALKVVVDPASGNVTILNGTGSPVDLRGYEILSENGTFDEAAANFLADSDGSWVQLTGDGSGTDLSEGHFTSMTVDASGEGSSIDLGDGVWENFFDEDVSFQYLVAGSDEPVLGLVEFSSPVFDFLDLNFDGTVDIQDWVEFLDITDTADLSALTQAQSYRKGDLDGDLQLGVGDFVTFQREFDRILGAGAFAEGLASLSVPEPTSALLVALGLAGLAIRRN